MHQLQLFDFYHIYILYYTIRQTLIDQIRLTFWDNNPMLTSIIDVEMLLNFQTFLVALFNYSSLIDPYSKFGKFE